MLQPRFDAEDMLRLIARHGVTHMHIVPTMFVRLLPARRRARRYDVSSLRWITHGAAPCAPAVKRQMIEWWGPVVTEYYGATETGVVVWHDLADALRKPGTVGRVVEGALLRIVDEQADVKRGEIGEIYVRGPHLAEFTYNNDNAKRREVALRAGDGGRCRLPDADGFVFLCDRKRDMIISGGVNIYPAEIRSVLIQMPGVRDCAVFGIPEEFGEQICAMSSRCLVRRWMPTQVRAFWRARGALRKVPGGRIQRRPAALRILARYSSASSAPILGEGGPPHLKESHVRRRHLVRQAQEQADRQQGEVGRGRPAALKTATPSQRLPPGQRQVETWPVLDLGIQPEIPTHAWRLFVDGSVEQPTTWKWAGFTDLPKPGW